MGEGVNVSAGVMGVMSVMGVMEGLCDEDEVGCESLAGAKHTE